MYQIKVEGMSCGHCVRSVTEAIHSLDPKAEVRVELQTQIITVESERQAEELKPLIEDAGYPVLASGHHL